MVPSIQNYKINLESLNKRRKEWGEKEGKRASKMRKRKIRKEGRKEGILNGKRKSVFII